MIVTCMQGALGFVPAAPAQGGAADSPGGAKRQRRDEPDQPADEGLEWDDAMDASQPAPSQLPVSPSSAAEPGVEAEGGDLDWEDI